MTSTDAKLAYGFELPKDISLEINPEEIGYEDEFGPEDIGEIWGQIYAARHGLPPSKKPYEEIAYKKYASKRDVIEKASGIEIIHHCSNEHTMYIVAIADSVVTAWRGYPKKISSLEIGPNWDEQIESFCKIMKLKYKKPHWLLCSYWG